MSDEVRRYLSPLEMLELRIALKYRIQSLGKYDPKKFPGIKPIISRCARLYARMMGIEPHNNPKLIIAQSVGLKSDWKTNYKNSWKQEIKRC